MTRRAVLTSLLAPLFGGPLDSPRCLLTPSSVPLVAPGEVLQIGLEATYLQAVREDGGHFVKMWLDEIHDWQLSVNVNGKNGTTRADLIRDLERLLALLDAGLPLTDPAGWGECVRADLVPHTAHCTRYEFER